MARLIDDRAAALIGRVAVLEELVATLLEGYVPAVEIKKPANKKGAAK
jgi:hypothetical protein